MWCYTTDRKTRWEYCAVPYCSNLTRAEAETILDVPETYYIITGSLASAVVLIGIIALVACVLKSRREDRNTMEPDLNPVYGAYDSVDYTVAEVEDTHH